MTATIAEQIAWQRQAVRVLAGLLETAARDHLPVLAWSVGSAGVNLVGRSFADPSPARRAAIAAWAKALGVELRELRGSGSTAITGTVKQKDTPWGWCTITLTADIYTEDDENSRGGETGDQAE